MIAQDLSASCRRSVANATVEWQLLSDGPEQAQQGRWCAAVGPPIVIRQPSTVELPIAGFVVVSWNTHVGAGNITALVDDLRAGRLTGGRSPGTFVLLLQEAYREGADIPSHPPPGAKTAGSISVRAPERTGSEIATVARRLGLDLFYAPSMRNGQATEDRGNAILSTVPLDHYTAIELPLERQRRVALAATLRVAQPDGTSIPVRVATAHLTNAVPRRGFLLSPYGRLRQVRPLTRALTDAPIVLAGDFNTWFGTKDAAYRELARRFDVPSTIDHRATFSMLRLDHVFVCLPDGWTVTSRRADRRYGSDHYPLIAEISMRSTQP